MQVLVLKKGKHSFTNESHRPFLVHIACKHMPVLAHYQTLKVMCLFFSNLFLQSISCLVYTHYSRGTKSYMALYNGKRILILLTTLTSTCVRNPSFHLPLCMRKKRTRKNHDTVQLLLLKVLIMLHQMALLFSG
jgi:hypothetical protein